MRRLGNLYIALKSFIFTKSFKGHVLSINMGIKKRKTQKYLLNKWVLTLIGLGPL